MIRLNKKNIKILYVAMKYDYGDSNRGFSFEHENFYKTIDNMFSNIIYFDFMELYKKFGKEEMNQMLLDVIASEKPALAFFCLYTDELDKDIIRYISNNTNTITFNWFCDDHWRFDNYSKFWAPCFNHVSTTDINSLEKYNKIGYDNVILTQWACNTFDYMNLNLPKKYEIIFVGQPHGSRREWIKDIVKSGINIKYWGYGWNNIPNKFIFKSFWYLPKKISLFRQYYLKLLNKIKNSTRISQREMIMVFNQSKINLNLSNSSTNQSQQIKGRNFEIPGCGGFMLTNYVEHLENYYKIGKEVICFNDLKDLKEKIKYYLVHEDEREKIAKAGYIRTIKEHTYEKRFIYIFKKMGII